MKRFVIATALALAGALGWADKADAQYVYGYNTINPYTGTLMTGQTYYTPFGAQAAYGYYNPYTGASGQRFMYQNTWGTNVYRSYGYNPYYGGGYTSGYYYPGFGASPYAGGWYRYRW
jgi:hypothetical protein